MILLMDFNWMIEYKPFMLFSVVHTLRHKTGGFHKLSYSLGVEEGLQVITFLILFDGVCFMVDFAHISIWKKVIITEDQTKYPSYDL